MGKTIPLSTALGTPIDNEQFSEISGMEQAQFGLIGEKYSLNIHVCGAPSARFNCHGLTFASRRTGIYESKTLDLILREDGFREVAPRDAMPGDVILYHTEDGDYEHSGIIVEWPERASLRIPLVRSKWGKYKELIHLANNSPYGQRWKYYRIVK